jgi:hypothetical protein
MLCVSAEVSVDSDECGVLAQANKRKSDVKYQCSFGRLKIKCRGQ